MLKKASWFVCFSILAVSCLEEPDCFRLNNNIVGISFRKMIGGEADTVALVGVQASGTDSIFNKFVLSSGVYLPLNFFQNQTTFALQGLDGVNQVVFEYGVRTQFVSEECGARYVLSDLLLLSHTFDSVRLVSNTPSAAEGGANIEVYRCPRTNLLKIAFRQLQGETSVPSALEIEAVTDDYSGTAYYLETTLQTINVPLNPAAGTGEFNVMFPDEDHTLAVEYVRRGRKFFDICGDQLTYGSLEVTGHDFDSLNITKDSLQDPPVTNITVYKCPQTNLARVSFRINGSTRLDTLNVVKMTDDFSGNIYYANEKITTAILPLNPDSNTTVFTFLLDDGSSKALTVNYSTSDAVAFNACGVQTTFALTTATAPAENFLRVQVLQTAVTFPIRTNIEIVINP